MRVGFGVVLSVVLLASCGQSERRPSSSGGGSGSGGDAEDGGRNGAAGSPSFSGVGASVSGAAMGGAAGSFSSAGRAGHEAAKGGYGPGAGGESSFAGVAGSAASFEDYPYCPCSCCSSYGRFGDAKCYFPEVAGDLESLQADEAAERAQMPCGPESCGVGVMYRACVAAEADPEPASYTSMPYIGDINRIFITKQADGVCTRLELTNELDTGLRTAVETSSTWKVAGALLTSCAGQTEHRAIGVTGTLEARGGRDDCQLELHLTAFFTDQKTGESLVKVRFDVDEMQLGAVPLACPP